MTEVRSFDPSTQLSRFIRICFKGLPFVISNAKYVEFRSFPCFLFLYLIPKFLWLSRKIFTKRLSASIFREVLYLYSLSDRIESFVDPVFLAGLLECVWATEGLPGDIIELGSYRGGTTVCLAHFLQTLGSRRKVYACDTFSGHPYGESTSRDCPMSKGQFSDTSLEYVKHKFSMFGVANRIQVVDGRFEDSLDASLGKRRFSLAFIDCDLYESAIFSLRWLDSRMTSEGIIAMHDYFLGSGVVRAVREWCSSNGLKVKLCPIPLIRIAKA